MVAGLVLVAMLLTAGLPWKKKHRAYGGPLLVALSVLWLVVNKDRMEGQILLTVSDHHGLTAGDLVGFAGIGLGVWRWRNPTG